MLQNMGGNKSYSLELQHASQNENVVVEYGTVNLDDNSSHKFMPNWKDLKKDVLIVQVDKGMDGTIDKTLKLSPESVYVNGNKLPTSVTLSQNYPNPFTQSTTITYALPEAQQVTLTVYDILGRKVATLVDGEKEAKEHTIQFDASSLGLASGVYLYRLVTDDKQKTEKMMFIR
jgi:hypothetical protein